ncbi:pre-toxin TG domain-containing protein [Streptococcus suis]|uniref:pre-toxin TG domain-containing protein n=1 Tax=Streptococcus suis TaxID=1307 RepID=UPI001E44F92E|nr:pre-toxin TG domain-containing protein [Streptococcus suis]
MAGEFFYVNDIYRVITGTDPITGEKASRLEAATWLAKILDATDDVVDTFDHVSDVAKTTDKLDDVEDTTKAGAGVGNPVTILGKGSTGRVVANTLEEQLAMKEVMYNPLANAFEVPITMTDTRWLDTEG